MLDSRRDCRYRRGAHRSIGVGLRKVTFHNMLGTSYGVPGFPLTLIHPSAWKGNTRKMAPSAGLPMPSAPKDAAHELSVIRALDDEETKRSFG
jgi:hypothetical protein